ncbi:hypothetical protein JNK13_04075 [bacterium]|nr:hypothetical protein [bacterium]
MISEAIAVRLFESAASQAIDLARLKTDVLAEPGLISMNLSDLTHGVVNTKITVDPLAADQWNLVVDAIAKNSFIAHAIRNSQIELESIQLINVICESQVGFKPTGANFLCSCTVEHCTHLQTLFQYLRANLHLIFKLYGQDFHELQAAVLLRRKHILSEYFTRPEDQNQPAPPTQNALVEISRFWGKDRIFIDSTKLSAGVEIPGSILHRIDAKLMPDTERSEFEELYQELSRRSQSAQFLYKRALSKLPITN